jgi:hypothetical protein
VIVLHLPFIIYQSFHKNYYLSDSKEYLQEAHNISNHGIFYCDDLSNPINPDKFTRRTPLYPLFIALCKLITANELLILIFQTLLSVFNLWLIRILGFKMGYTVAHDRIFLVLLLLTPAQFLYANFIMSELLLQTFIVLICYTLFLWIDSKKTMYLVGYHIFLVCAMFTKPAFYLFALPNLVFIFILTKKYRRLWQTFTAAIPVVCIIAYSGWNYQRTSHYHFSSISTTNLMYYNTYYFIMQKDGEAKADSLYYATKRAADAIPDYTRRQKFLVSTATGIIKNNLPAYSFFHAKGMVYFFIDPGRFDLYHFFAMEKPEQKGFLYTLNKGGIKGLLEYLASTDLFLLLILLIIVTAQLLKTAGIVKFVTIPGIPAGIQIFFILFLLYTAFITGPLGASRFIVPFSPLILLMNSMGLAPMIKSKRKILSFGN